MFLFKAFNVVDNVVYSLIRRCAMCEQCNNPQTVWDKETVEHIGMCDECYREDIALQVMAFLANQDAESFDSQLLECAIENKTIVYDWNIPF